MYSYSENNDFNSILTRLLNNVSDEFDKREGSIIYDALAPAAIELAQCYIALDVYADQTNLLTATGQNLDNRVIECGLTRLQATPARVTIHVTNNIGALMEIPIGTRFAVPNQFGGYVFNIIEEQSTGVYTGECETLGKDGNTYLGILLPIQSINNLGQATIVSIDIKGEDQEDDNTLRARALAKLNEEAFAGNVAAYKRMTIENETFGVEDCKVYPVWNGGGSVKLALIGPNHTLLSESGIEEIQKAIDPAPQGTGVGLAPIGHTVTVVTPNADNLTISATLTLDGDTSLTQIRPKVVQELQNYIYEVQSDFVDKDTLIIYIAKVIAAILNIKEVQNVTDVKINNVAQDYLIDNSLSDPNDDIYYPILLDNGVILE